MTWPSGSSAGRPTALHHTRPQSPCTCWRDKGASCLPGDTARQLMLCADDALQPGQDICCPASWHQTAAVLARYAVSGQCGVHNTCCIHCSAEHVPAGLSTWSTGAPCLAASSMTAWARGPWPCPRLIICSLSPKPCACASLPSSALGSPPAFAHKASRSLLMASMSVQIWGNVLHK